MSLQRYTKSTALPQKLVPTKACPVVLRDRGALEILAFEHPLAGLQLVKGSIEPGEQAVDAAVRELWEESGLTAAGAVSDLGLWTPGYADQIWSFHLCEIGLTPETWLHRTTDGGGLEFRFFWHPLNDMPSGSWHWVFRDALATISERLDARS